MSSSPQLDIQYFLNDWDIFLLKQKTAELASCYLRGFEFEHGIDGDGAYDLEDDAVFEEWVAADDIAKAASEELAQHVIRMGLSGHISVLHTLIVTSGIEGIV